MSTPASVSPGWYPDPAGSGAVRWWDGERWTEHTGAASASGAVASRAPEGTRPDTVWIWLIVLLPLLAALALLTIDWAGYFRDVISTSGNTSPTAAFQAQLALYSQPGFLIGILLGWLTTIASIVFAWLDTRALKARGVPNPFPWAWAFTSLIGAGNLVYVIGRSVVVRRRTGRGLGPIWGLIAVFLVGLVIGIAVTVMAVSAVTAIVPPGGTLAP